MSLISTTGYWNIDGKRFDDEHVFDENLSLALCDYLKSTNNLQVYDLGCGPGWYTHSFYKNGIDSKGFDGNPITSKIEHCTVQDLTQPINVPKINCILCLEVGEHIPKEYECNLLDNIDNLLNINGILILSWAVRNQHGFGHVNCLNNDEVIKKFEDRNYLQNEYASKMFRSKATLSWFKNTIMVFHKK